MRVNNTLKAGDILYRVDPSKLSVKVFRVYRPEEDKRRHDVATTYENFWIEEGEHKCFLLSLTSEEYPFRFKGRLYFLTEDDATNYIKTQIGM